MLLAASRTVSGYAPVSIELVNRPEGPMQASRPGSGGVGLVIGVEDLRADSPTVGDLVSIGPNPLSGGLRLLSAASAGSSARGAARSADVNVGLNCCPALRRVRGR